MTSDHPLRRALARLCSADTMSRIVDPIFADMRWEDGRASVRGCASLTRALTLHAITSVPGWLAAAWSEDGFAIAKATGHVMAASTLAAILLLLPPLWGETALMKHLPWSTRAVIWVTLVPQAAALALPTAILFAIPLAFRRVSINARLVRRTVLLSLFIAAVTFAVITWLMPDANQLFRETMARAIGRPVHFQRGPNETDWTTLRRQIDDLHRYSGGQAAAAQLEYVYQLRLAIVVAAVPLGLGGLVISMWKLPRRWALPIAAGVLITYWMLMMVDERLVKTLIARGGSLA